MNFLKTYGPLLSVFILALGTLLEVLGVVGSVEIAKGLSGVTGGLDPTQVVMVITSVGALSGVVMKSYNKFKSLRNKLQEVK